MEYEEFIYELIKLFIDWGVWTESVKIFCGNKVYAPCQMPKSESEKFFDYEEDVRRKAVYEAEKERSIFRDIKNVIVSDVTEEDKEFIKRWPKNCEMSIELNGALCKLFAFGILEVDLSDLPLSRKIDAYDNRIELQERFQEEYDIEEMKIHPEEYGIPSELEFDSSEEYEQFFDEELHRIEDDFIANLDGTIEFDNDLEAEISVLCIKHNLSYCGGDAYLFIGHDYF